MLSQTFGNLSELSYTKLPGDTNLQRNEGFAYDVGILELISLSSH